MGDQQSLPLWPRDHDLPPRWDGLPVEWGEWTDTSTMFICPPPKRTQQQCSKCRSVRAPLINVGRIWTEGDLPEPVVHNGRRRIIGLITAFRCPGCRHDQVLDHEQKTWDLDPTDYTDGGSYAHG